MLERLVEGEKKFVYYQSTVGYSHIHLTWMRTLYKVFSMDEREGL